MWTNGQNVAVTPKEGQPQPQPNTGILDDGPDLPF
jgi:hypothetical protein